MTDTQPCITEGEHVRSQRHLRASCPVGPLDPDTLDQHVMDENPTTCPRDGARTLWDDLPDGRQHHVCRVCGHQFLAVEPDPEDEPGISVRYLLVELPLREDEDPDDTHAAMQSIMHAEANEDDRLAEAAVVTLIYPGDVVSPEDTAEHEQLRALHAAAQSLADSPDASGDDIAEAWQDVLRVALTRWPGIG